MALDEDKLTTHLSAWLQLLPSEAVQLSVHLAINDLAPLAVLELPATRREVVAPQIAELLQEYADLQQKAVRFRLDAQRARVKGKVIDVERSLPLRVRPTPETSSELATARAPQVNDSTLTTMLEFSKAQMSHIERLHELGSQRVDGFHENFKTVMEMDRRKIETLAREATENKSAAEMALAQASAAYNEASAFIDTLSQSAGKKDSNDEFKGFMMGLAKEWFFKKMGMSEEDIKDAQQRAEAAAAEQAAADTAAAKNGAQEPAQESAQDTQTPPPSNGAG